MSAIVALSGSQAYSGQSHTVRNTSSIDVPLGCTALLVFAFRDGTAAEYTSATFDGNAMTVVTTSESGLTSVSAFWIALDPAVHYVGTISVTGSNATAYSNICWLGLVGPVALSTGAGKSSNGPTATPLVGTEPTTHRVISALSAYGGVTAITQSGGAEVLRGSTTCGAARFMLIEHFGSGGITIDGTGADSTTRRVFCPVVIGTIESAQFVPHGGSVYA